MQVFQNLPKAKCGNGHPQKLGEQGSWCSSKKEDNSYLLEGAYTMQRNSNVKAPAKILDNVLDISSTIAKILTVCGVDQRKANQAVSSITNSFLNFNEKVHADAGLVTCKTRHLRKEELLKNLKNDCNMTDSEAKLAASVVKCAFRAFFHKQSLRKYDPGYYSQADWQAAAHRTILAYSKAGATKSDLELAAKRIQEAYKGYLERVQLKGSPMVDTDNDALNRENSYQCSVKNRYIDQLGQDNQPLLSCPYQQISCQCCGCLKQSPAAYRDSKGRSILFMENNDLYYNAQPMKNTMYAMRGSQYPRTLEATCEEALPKVLYKLTRDMINRVLRNTRLDALAGEVEEDECYEGLPCRKSFRKSSQSALLSKRKSKQKSIQKPAQKHRICDCDNKVDDSPRDDDYTSNYTRRHSKGVATPPNSLEEIAAKVNIADSDAVVQIALKGICQTSKDGRPRIEVLGLKLMNSESTDTSEYVCKRRVRLVNRYTQTDGSAGPSESASRSASTSSTARESKRLSMSLKRVSQTTDKRQSTQSSGKHSERYSESIRIQQPEYQYNAIDDITKTSTLTLAQQTFVAETENEAHVNEDNEMEDIPVAQEIQEVQVIEETHTNPEIQENPHESPENTKSQPVPEPSQDRPSAGMNAIEVSIRGSLQKTSFQVGETQDPEPPTEGSVKGSVKEGDPSSTRKSAESKPPDFEITSLKNPPEVIDNKSNPPEQGES